MHITETPPQCTLLSLGARYRTVLLKNQMKDKQGTQQRFPEEPRDCLQSHFEYIPRNPSISQRVTAQFRTGKSAQSVFHLFLLLDLHWIVCVCLCFPPLPVAGAIEWMRWTWKALFSLVTHTRALLLGCAPWVTGLH